MLLTDLPIEILPEIIDHVAKPQHLAHLCLVNKAFHRFAVPKLYERVYIYSWHREGKAKACKVQYVEENRVNILNQVIQLFDTLSRYVYLANHLRRLEIRDFPKALTAVDNDILNHVLHGLKNCHNLRSCTWTRDGSLNSDVLKTLQSCDNLRDLEFNGHNEGHYDARLLPGFTKLERILIIMPSQAVISQLSPWFTESGSMLRSFTLICKGSNLITDALLQSIAPCLPNLQHLNLTGCPKVTHNGVWAIISSTVSGLLGLGLEGVSMRFDMAILANRCLTTGSLSLLRSITLTVHQQLSMKEWIHDVLNLISASPLERFQIYSIGVSFEALITEDLWNNLVLTHASRLVRISVHRMLISLEAIANICSQCTNLEELFVVMESSALDDLANYLSLAKKLRTVHINSPIDASTDVYPFVLKVDRALSIIKRCNPALNQLGCNSKVWQVDRQIIREDDGTLRSERVLAPYGSPDIPEQFTVVRT
ncbi:hypothetical protein HYPSUDRAFT_66002 [Hypholoma sublateritium FD-334 SS-4]|uniref:F-box domain-containing protein n=1 Tax=Hypholoma sublateritium (strain FD-334 SS-4) TaxID=945553 RepID=A0A0D2NYV1_HYPSF|nr:hypothetical protein HYPSUDRAFT_66002 [Hypholoma sublateritium FD-334 SS-4]